MTAVTLIALGFGIALSAAAEGRGSGTGEARATTAEVEVLARERWTTHVVTPRERLAQIAARYGVRLGQVLEWNELQAGHEPRRGDRLRIKSRLRPPPRVKTIWVVRPGDTWRDIARHYRIEHRDLRAYNWRVDALQPGTELLVWYEPSFPRTVNRRPGPTVPRTLGIPSGGLSIGYPDQGRVENGVQLPERTEYTRRHPSSSWGSSHTIENLIRALASFRHRSGFEGEVVVMAISRRHGRRFPPHDSHQSGRDVDIRLPLLPHVPDTALPNPDEVDWAATWELVRGLAETGAVDAIYLQVELQRRLYQAALWEGMEPEQLGSIIQWPSKSGPDGALVRHESGHENHMHVRFRCGPAESRCRSR